MHIVQFDQAQSFSWQGYKTNAYRGTLRHIYLADVVEPELLIEDLELFALSIGDCDSYLAFDFR